ncbi:MAG TPA: protein kinase [Terriglobales bacterium]|nr:protein kinase [Terriglobales bacterium]
MEGSLVPRKLAGRYEVREVLGQGGMGVVYRAYDTVIRREVAVKTILDIPDPASLQLFYRECDVLASMSHPNIVEIFDIGEFEEGGKNKPYFVMPLLPGTTLETFIRQASHRLTVERTVGIITQACRGLQAAHERGLVHRDLKPSNIFVMEDDSVKIIDFGVAHITETRSTRALKGTLLYMSPEQIEMKPLSALSDIFSLSVVCYEALTGRQPFQRARPDEIVEAIRKQVPPPASEINPAVSQSIGHVVHKGMAKQPWHRFSSAREFSEVLNKALRNEPIEFFDPSRTRPRLERATKALESGDYQFAGEILGELEAEGHIDSSIGRLRHQLDAAVRRKTIAQLLEAAKARFEEQEDPLALQKLQDILEMEPDNAQALSLRSQIENRRSDKQIENWYRLARQHIDNHAYPHALEALQNVLQLRPKEGRALQLIAEVDRQEHEYNKLRQEKTQIHRAAMEAWQKGDVSSALSKLAVVLELDRRAPDASTPEHDATYQSLYNEVRSEHDAMNTAYAEARKQLRERNFGKALATCETYVTKYPNNAIFQALKYDIEEQQRQELSAYIAAIDRQVEAEPDLDKRVNILKEALEQHPGETHFERALRPVKDKRDLVNSIVARALHHEAEGAFGDALNDWEILRTIYSQYPGLKFEVERLQKRREQQSRIEAKTGWVEKIDACMHSSDYGRALDLLQQAKAEFPNDAELAELEKLANDGVQRSTEAHRLMTEGQELCAQNRAVEGIKLLREAYELDEHNALTRAVLCNALLEQARVIAESNWQEADRLAQQAVDLNPGHPLAKTVRTLISDQKREQLVSEFLSQARKLQAAGDVAGARARIEEALAAYPREPRLVQTQDTLKRELLAQRGQARRRDLGELRRMEQEAETLSDAATRQASAERVLALANRYLDDEEVLSSANGLLQRLNVATVQGKKPSQDREERKSDQQGEVAGSDAGQSTMSLYSTPTMDGPPPAAETKSEPAPPLAATPVTPAVPPSSPKSEVKPAPARPRPAITGPKRPKPPVKLSRGQMVVAGASVVALLLVFWLLGRHPRPASAPPPVAQFGVLVHTTPAGATISVNHEVRGVSDLQIDLPGGTYQIEAQLQGYRPQTVAFDAKAGAPNSIELTLEPALAVVELSSDTGAGKVSFDDQSPVDLEGAQWTLNNIAPGEHKLKFDGPQGSASFSFATEAGAMPVVKRPITAKGVLAVVVSNLGDRLQVFVSDPAAKLSWDGQTPTAIGQDGWQLTQVRSGTHELTLTQASDQYKLDVDTGPMPSLTAFLESGRNIGTLVVVAGEDKARVFLNGQLQKDTTQGGQMRISNLEPKDYVVKVSKEGFQDLPEQRVRILKGEERKLTFNLQPIPHFGSLSIQGGTPGSQVLIDQVSAGTVQPDGSFSTSNISPGDHVLELRKDGFKPKRLQKRFGSGSNVAVTPAEAALEAATGEIKITFTPPDATVSLTKAGEPPIKVTSGNAVNLPPGTYTLTTRMADNLTRTSTVEVVAGQFKAFDLPLGPSGMSLWDDPTGWKQDKGTFVHKGGDFVLYNVSPTSGTFVFSAMLQKGHRLQWVVNCVDAQNYVLFQMDDNNFYRSVFRNGQKTDEAKIPYKSEKKSFHTIQIHISPSEVVQQTKSGDSWAALDKWSGANLAAGKFGFYIPGNDQIALSSFKRYADLGAH